MEQSHASQSVEFLGRDRAGSYGMFGSVFIGFGREAPDQEGAQLFGQCAKKFLGTLNEPGGFLMIVRQASTPAPEAREHTVQVFRELALGGVTSTCIVIEATGFIAAVQRSIATAFLPKAVRDCKVHVAKRTDDGVAWMAQQLFGPATGSEQLLSAVSRFVRDEDC